MHEIKFIRENFAEWSAAIAKRPLSEEQRDQVASILELDLAERGHKTRRQDAEAARNASSRLIGLAKAKGDELEAQRLMVEVAQLKDTIDEASIYERMAALDLKSILNSLPNTPMDDVPVGFDEDANKEERVWAPSAKTSGQLLNQPKDHVTLGEAWGMMDFEAAARMSGARFVALKGQLARLERALAAFMVDLQTEVHGYTEVSPPLLVRREAAHGTGQLPKFEQDLFRSDVTYFEATEGFDVDGTPGKAWKFSDAKRQTEFEQALEHGDWHFSGRTTWPHGKPENTLAVKRAYYLIPTAEVSLTNLYRETILAEADLATPIRMTADTPCFRSEAGSAGRDTRGMIRMHQFRKVELVSICKPEDSAAEHDRMVNCAEEVLKRLGLPFRTMLLCSGDMGFTAKKTYDLEVWLPSQNKYREISSCSNCGDFQARRMDARFRRDGQKGTEFVHTLNGSGLAVGRTLVAVLENYQNADGSVTLPDVLVPYMGGKTKIG